MQMHYIDDDDLDLRALKLMARNHRDIQLTSSNSLSDLGKFARGSDADLVVLDIHRPDATSLEEDVMEVRRKSDAPVVFVTGGEAEEFRVRAAEAGAAAVLAKDTLSVDLLRETLLNARAREKMFSGSGGAATQSAKAPDKKPAKVMLPLSYFEDRMARALASGSESFAKPENDRFMLDATTAMRTASAADSDDEQPTKEEQRERLHSLRDGLVAAARVKGATLIFDVHPDTFAKIGPLEKAALGLQHLVTGLLSEAQAGDALLITARSSDDGVELEYASTRQLLIEWDFMFNRRCPSYRKCYDAMFSLSLAAMLLGLERDDLAQVSSSSGDRVLIAVRGD